MYCGYVTKLKNIRPHSNADRLELADAFGMTIIIGKDSFTENDLVLYFPTEGQLSVEYCEKNNLVRKKDENGNNIGGYLDPDKRNIKALKLRGERSEGLVMPLDSLAFTGVNLEDLVEGFQITVVNGIEICEKYIPRGSGYRRRANHIEKYKKKETEKFIFPEHIETEQLKFYVDRFKVGDLLTITEKLEGTSGRSAMLKVKKVNGWFRKLLHLKERECYKTFCGSRRVTIKTESCKDEDGGYYGSNEFRKEVHKQLVPHLTPGLEVFYEIVGWPAPGEAPLMGRVRTKCLNDREFTAKYGEEMVFSYGLEEGTYDFYIYRIAEVDDDGDIRIEYSTDQIINWCEKHGFKYVPLLWRGILGPDQDIVKIAERFNDGESTIGAHWREGCVIRRDNNAAKFDVYKDKNWTYKALKGMANEELANQDTSMISEDILEEM